MIYRYRRRHRCRYFWVIQQHLILLDSIENHLLRIFISLPKVVLSNGTIWAKSPHLTTCALPRSIPSTPAKSVCAWDGPRTSVSIQKQGAPPSGKELAGISCGLLAAMEGIKPQTPRHYLLFGFWSPRGEGEMEGQPPFELWLPLASLVGSRCVIKSPPMAWKDSSLSFIVWSLAMYPYSKQLSLISFKN